MGCMCTTWGAAHGVHMHPMAMPMKPENWKTNLA